MGTSLDIEEIKKLYPNEWVLIGNPIKKENSLNIASGTPNYQYNSNINEQVGIKEHEISISDTSWSKI